MHLSENDIHLFYKLHPTILFYVNKKLEVLGDTVSTPDEFRRLDMGKIIKVRDRLWENVWLIDSFVTENPFEFSKEELDIVSGWKQYIKGRFFVIRYLKNYAVFLDDKKPAKVYGVKALISPFEDTIGDYFPIMVDAVLLPFKEWIIYDGFLSSHNIHFGGGIRADLSEEFKVAKAQFGIIESLSGATQSTQEDDAEKLKRYVQTETSREHFSKEIFNLVKKNHELEVLYHQEMGKMYARSYKKDLRNIGISSGWFGILQGLMIVSATTKEELNQAIKKIVPAEKQDLVCQFQMKGTKKKII